VNREQAIQARCDLYARLQSERRCLVSEARLLERRMDAHPERRYTGATLENADRRATTRGMVRAGEIVVKFARQLPSRRCEIESFRVVLDAPTDPARPLKEIKHERRVEGYRLTMPDGSTLDVPDPLVRS
jgi:hypothetical protein